MKKCKVEGCRKKYLCKGYCQMHWARWKKWGDHSIVKRHLPTPELVAAKMKRCPGCKEIKPYSEFGKSKCEKDGYHSQCKKCMVIKREKVKKKFNGLNIIWKGMKQRCLDPKSKYFKYYGGRGITVCKEWQDNFISFYNWAVKAGHKKGLEIDRRNNDGNYCPENCRFVTRIENIRNR